jgi:hypothetical protein
LCADLSPQGEVKKFWCFSGYVLRMALDRRRFGVRGIAFHAAQPHIIAFSKKFHLAEKSSGTGAPA